MSQQKWFYELLSEEFGPVTSEQIRELVLDGTLSASDRVRQENSDTWITAAEVPDESADSGEAEELTDLSELNFSFEDSGSGDAPPADQPDIDAFNIQGDSEAPAPPAADNSYAGGEAQTEPEYYVDSLGHVLGPMPLEELIRMADGGVLTESDKIREGADGSWMSPLDMDAVAAAVQMAGSTADDTHSQPDIGAGTARRIQIQQTDVDAVAESTNSETESAGDVAAPAEPPPQESGDSKPGKDSKRKKKKKKGKKDEFLQEIFSEVFTDEGKVREDRLSSEGSTAAAAAGTAPSPAAPAAAPAAPAAAAATPAAPSVPVPAAASTASPPPGMPPSPPQSAAPSPPPAAPPPRPAFTPPAKRKKAGMSFSAPDPRTLGIVGGVVVLILVIVGGATGMFYVPGFAPDTVAYLKSVTDEYRRIAKDDEAVPSAADWEALRKRATDEGQSILSYYGTGNLTPEDNTKRWAVAKVVELVKCEPDDTERRAMLFAATKKLMESF